MGDQPKIYFGDPESIKLRDQGRITALAGSLECPGYRTGRIPHLLKGNVISNETINWACQLCESEIDTDLEGTVKSVYVQEEGFILYREFCNG